MNVWQHWIVGQVDASIVAALLLAVALATRRRLSPDVRSAILLIALIRLTLPPWIRSPWSEAMVDLPPLDAARLLVSEAVRVDLTAYVFGVWATVAIYCLARLAWRFFSGQRRLLATTIPAPEWVRARVIRLTADTTRSIDVRLSPSGDGPFAAGLTRRLIILPAASIDALDAGALDAVLAHEIAHHARRDLLWILAASALASIAWFHPLAHVIARAIVASREDGSDDWAVSRTAGDPFAYAQALLKSARMASVDRVAIVAGAHPIGKRLHRLLDGHAPRDGRPGVAGLVLILVAIAVAIPGAHMPDAGDRDDDRRVIRSTRIVHVVR